MQGPWRTLVSGHGGCTAARGTAEGAVATTTGVLTGTAVLTNFADLITIWPFDIGVKFIGIAVINVPRLTFTDPILSSAVNLSQSQTSISTMVSRLQPSGKVLCETSNGDQYSITKVKTQNWSILTERAASNQGSDLPL